MTNDTPRTTCRWSWLGIVLVLGAALPLCAQHNPEAASLDYIVANADQVIVGRIVEVGSATRDNYGEYQQQIVLAVEETLKGDRDQRLPLVLAHDLWRPQFDAELPLSDPAGSSFLPHRLLVAVRKKSAYPPEVDAVDLDSDKLSVVTADLELLSNSVDIVQAAKAEVRRIPVRPKEGEYFNWLPMHDYDSLKGTHYDGCGIYVPVDKRLEDRALALLRAPNETLEDIGHTHSMAVEALRFFRSDENIRLLTGLLSAPDNSTRQAAYGVLKGWGLDVTAPAVSHE
jgi:hypothetical protein